MEFTAINLIRAYEDTPDEKKVGFLRCYIDDLKRDITKYSSKELEKIRLWAVELVNNYPAVKMKAAEIVDIIPPEDETVEHDECQTY